MFGDAMAACRGWKTRSKRRRVAGSFNTVPNRSESMNRVSVVAYVFVCQRESVCVYVRVNSVFEILRGFTTEDGTSMGPDRVFKLCLFAVGGADDQTQVPLVVLFCNLNLDSRMVMCMYANVYASCFHTSIHVECGILFSVLILIWQTKVWMYANDFNHLFRQTNVYFVYT